MRGRPYTFLRAQASFFAIWGWGVFFSHMGGGGCAGGPGALVRNWVGGEFGDFLWGVAVAQNVTPVWYQTLQKRVYRVVFFQTENVSTTE